MNHLMARSVSGIQWRSKALLRSMTPIGRKRLMPVGIAMDKLGLPFTELPLSPDNFLLPLDFLPDSATLAGAPIAKFLAVVGLDFDAAENDHLSYLLKNHGQKAVTDPVVVVGLKDGRWMVASGERVVAAALKLGQDSITVQILPLGEALAGISDIQKTLYPHHRFRKNLALLGNLGLASDAKDPTLVALANEFRTDPLVKMGHTYHPIPFPEFQNMKLQADNDATYRRLAMVLERLENPAGKKVLDLGCNVGFMVFSLAFRGCWVSGLDINPRFVDVARKVARAKGINAQFVESALEPGLFEPGKALDLLWGNSGNENEKKVWDLVTCFSMLQWVNKSHDIAYCQQILREISGHTKALLVDIPVNCSGVYLEAPVGREISWVEKFLRSSCDFKEYKYVGKVSPYKIDQRHVFYCHH